MVPSYRQLNPLSRLIVLGIACLLLTACETVNFAKPPSKGSMGPTEGTVLLAVTGNTGQIAQLDFVQLKQKPVPGRPTTFQVLTNVAKGVARDTAVFAGIVPAGEYDIDQLTVRTIGPAVYNLNDAAKELLGSVRVVAGSVSDLGRVIVTPINGKVITGRSTLPLSNVELIKTFSAENATFLGQPIIEGWITPRTEKDRIEELALATPVGANTPTELPNGIITAASRLGSILLRDPNGNWSSARADTRNSFLGLMPVTEPIEDLNAVLIAVGEFNTMAYLDAKGKMLRLNPGNLPPGNLLNIAGNPQVGWFVAHQQQSSVVIYRSDRLRDGQWEPLRKENTATSFWSGENAFWIWRTPTGFAYAISAGKIAHYDFATRAWTETRAPDNDRIITLAPSAKGLGILTSPGGGFGGAFATMYVSNDLGSTWTKINSPYKVKLYAPRVLDDGTLLVGGGGMFATPELQASSDGGATWRVISDNVSAEEDIVVLPTGGLLAIRAGQSFGFASIKHSSNGGASWKLEYSNVLR